MVGKGRLPKGGRGPALCMCFRPRRLVIWPWWLVIVLLFVDLVRSILYVQLLVFPLVLQIIGWRGVGNVGRRNTFARSYTRGASRFNGKVVSRLLPPYLFRYGEDWLSLSFK